jgi:hypothetical protein
MKPVKVHEGDWFAVPLRNGGYALGLAARVGKGGIVFGYFFGPKREKKSLLNLAASLTAGDAVLVRLFGDLGIRLGDWPILGTLASWRREEWPMPIFGRVVDEGRGIAWRVDHGDDPRSLGTDTRCSVEEAKRLPPDSLSGYGAVEIVLTKLLDG